MVTVVVSATVDGDLGEGTSNVNNFWSVKKWELRQAWDIKNGCASFDVANVIIGVDMKFDYL